MFSFHETTQRRICRWAFVAFAIVPTLLALGTIIYVHRPWREADWQQTLSRQLHVRAEIGRVSNPRPGITRLADVRLADLRTGQPLCAISELRASWHGGELSLRCDELQVHAAQFSALATTLSTCTASAELPVFKLQADLAKIVGPQGQMFVLAKLQLRTDADDSRSLRWQLRAETVEQEANPLKLSVEQLSDEPQTVRCVLNSQAARIPGWLMADVLPSVGQSESASFSGMLQLDSTVHQLICTVSGRFENIPLEQWSDAGNNRHLQGVATIALEHARWKNDRLEQAHGNLVVQGGQASNLLLEEFVKRLYCRPAPGLANRRGSLPHANQTFDELACRFHLTREGIAITGTCKSCADGTLGCLLAIDGQPMLLEPQYKYLPVAHLVQIFSAPTAYWLPASEEAHAMADTLPLPSVRPVKQKEVASRSVSDGGSSK